MKVVLLAPTPPPNGGIASWTVRMMNAELKNGWEVVVVDEKIPCKRQLYDKVTVKNLWVEVRRYFRIWSDLFRALRDPDVRVVHSCIPAGTRSMIRELVCAVITKLKKRRFITHFRCTVPNMKEGFVWNLVLKLLGNISDAIIVLNKKSAEFLSTVTGSRIELIPNFADCHDDSIDIKNDIATVLYVGGVIESKGCLDMFRIAEKFPDIKFRMVGAIGVEISKDSVPSNVELTGEQPHADLTKEYINSDVFMFMTYFRGEGFSNSLVEAMSYGVPCIVSDWAANKDMIEDKGGVVVGVRDVDGAVKALESISDSEIRRAMSEWNKEKVRDFYSEEIVTEKYVDLYEAL